MSAVRPSKDLAVRGPALSSLPIVAVVGLGNPGKKYEATRHNAGFWVVQALAERLGASWSQKFQGQFAKTHLRGTVSKLATTQNADAELALLQPGTFMNLSGHPTQAMAAFFGYKPLQILVIHDELDLPWGRLALKVGGGHGGHNGLRSLVSQLGSADFVRLRVGIGRPAAGQKVVDPDAGRGDARADSSGDQIANWVLSPPSASERAELADVVERALAMVQDAIVLGAATAMNQHNRK
jgi:PTH1 family peptidyl-tRNA hydrolase